MSRSTAGRALTVAALAATMVASGVGSPAGAAPAVGPPYTASTATAVLGAGTDDVAEVTITAVKGSAPALVVNLYLEGLSCTVGVSTATPTISSLRTAAVSGDYPYSCTPGGGGQGLAEDTLTGTASVDVVWTGVGEARKAALDHCVGRYRVRPAAVAASVTLTGDVTHDFGTAAPDDAHLSYTHAVCPPGIP